jgi:ABC-type branched-subunit amino acid transport system substrate-binding protein
MKRTIAVRTASLAGLAIVAGSLPSVVLAAAAPKAGAACTAAQLGTTSGSLSCVKDGRKRVWKAAAPTTAAPAAAPAPAGAAAAPTTAAVAAGAPAGLKSGPGFDGKTIIVGNITSKTNAAWGPLSRGIGAALEAHFKAINAKGGIGGKYPVKIEEYETNYDPNIAVQGLNATKDKVVMYASVLGTPVNEALLPLYEQNKLVASPGSLDAKWISKKNMLPVLTSYQVQAINGVAYYLEKSPGKTICAVSRQDAYGETGTEGVKFAQSKLKFNLGPIETVPATQTDMAAVVVRLRDAKCDAVYLTTGPAQATALLVQGSQNSYTPQWILMSPTFSDKQVTPATSTLYEKYVWMSGDGVEWGDKSAPGMKDLVSELSAAGFGNYVAGPDIGNVWGYAQAKVVETVLEQAVKNGDLSREGLLKAASEVGPADIGGVGATVDMKTRQPASKNSIFKADGSKQLAISLLVKEYGTAAAAEYRKS